MPADRTRPYEVSYGRAPGHRTGGGRGERSNAGPPRDHHQERTQEHPLQAPPPPPARSGWTLSGGPPPAGPRGRRTRARRRRRWHLLLAIPALLGVYVLWSVVGALTTVGNQSFSAKWADWLRGHDAAFIVNPLESLYYSSQAPAKGGRPKSLNTVPGTAPAPSHPAAVPSAPSHLPAPRPVPLVVSPALPGEGQWQPVGPTVDGTPTMYEAQFRADDVYTSEITTAVWIDPKLASISLIPGQTEPGGTWTHPPYITNAELPRIMAAFNGGFRMSDAQGGFYLDGRTAVPLRPGAASMVIYKNGSINIGSWGSQVTMTPSVAAVLQNLVLMVDNGQVSSAATYTDTRIWGATLGAATVVARSGIGVTADGALVYVAGPALTARTLAEALQRAGAVRAMTLDINPEWVTFNFFSHPNPADPAEVTPAKLYPQMQRPADRYLGPTMEARDFFEVSLR
jgi:hypothetical protein